ncbi:UNVERIFIED_CONTAM: helix-turn-helix transcriptional regulator [Methylobacteriaceae bacterium AG10]|nr:helix-turn-helix transcriptional regulator [Methylobacteriaceae bacterium AG10]
MPKPVNPDDRAVGQRIYAARKRKGLSQDEATLALGLPDGAMSQFERGVRPVPAPTLGRIAEFLGADLTYLVTGTAGRAEISPTERDLIRRYRKLSPESRLALCRVSESLEVRA